MSDLTISKNARRLTPSEIGQFHERGFIKNLPLLEAEEVKLLQTGFTELLEMVPPDVDIYRMNNWHKANRWFYELTRLPAILDYVEDLLGPNFNQWGGAFFVKFPHDESTVPWHQDAKYWPLEPRTTVTVWLAVFDADAENGCMRVVPGSHRRGDLHHDKLPEAKDWSQDSDDAARDSKYVLWQTVDAKSFDEADAVDIDMKAGEISLHDDDLIHGSPGNPSDRMRAGITLRFCPTDVKCDLSVWPNFEVYPARGVDHNQFNPVAQVPTKKGYPTRFNQKSTEFA